MLLRTVCGSCGNKAALMLPEFCLKKFYLPKETFFVFLLPTLLCYYHIENKLTNFQRKAIDWFVYECCTNLTGLISLKLCTDFEYINNDKGNYLKLSCEILAYKVY